MNEVAGHIESGDYLSAGRFSKEIKNVLKRIGVDPAIVRRAMVAVYEAEMNVVIHSHGGAMRAAIAPEALYVAVMDTGPGIADIEEALREGYSTAPEEARNLGFGAGMGLPNIQRNTDRFSIHSKVGRGTQLRFTIFLKPQTGEEPVLPALRLNGAQCRRCLRCLHACPTQAIRIRSEGPVILPHLCIGCTACMSACPFGVFGLDCSDDAPEIPPDSVLLAPAVLRGQFGKKLSQNRIEEECSRLGVARVLFADTEERALAVAIQAHASKKEDAGLVLPPTCPAVVNLIQTRYPGLLGKIPPFLGAVESLLESVEEHCLVVGACPAICALTRKMRTAKTASLISPAGLLRLLMPPLHQVIETEKATEKKKAACPSLNSPGSLRISGMAQVCQFLDKAENGLVGDCGIVELYACESGCFGAPLWPEHPEVARFRSVDLSGATDRAEALVLCRAKALEARVGLRLDSDMGRAISKLAEINKVRATLPGRDCGVCGSPTCQILAEDIVLGRASLTACIYRTPDTEENNSPKKENTL